jgi:hypothetical protein
MLVYYQGQPVEAERLSSGGQTFWQIGRNFVPDMDVAIPEAPRFTPDSPPPAPLPTPELTEAPPMADPVRPRRGKKAPVVPSDTEAPLGGELSEDVADPRNR